MPVGVNPVNKSNNDAQLLSNALNIASLVYGVRLNAKQKEEADKLAGVKEAAKAEAEAAKTAQEQKAKGIELTSKFIEVPQGTKGASPIQLPGEDAPKMRIPTDVYKTMLDNESKIRTAQLAGAAKPEKGQKGQEELDKAFAKEYAEYVTSGGSSTLASNLSQLREISGALSGKDPVSQQEVPQIDSATGGLTSLLPKAARDYAAPQAAALQDRLEQVVQGSMKQVLGAQFTEKEGRNVLARAFNVRQSPEENAKRVNLLFNQLSAAAQAKQAAIDYYEENGTLRGFKGKIYNINDIDSAIANVPGNNNQPMGEANASGGMQLKKIDPKIDAFAKANNLNYMTAKQVLQGRGYQPNE